MPVLDVTEILGDPDFAQQIMVRRGVLTEDDNGRGSMSYPPDVSTSAVVVPASGYDLMRLPDAERNEEHIRVYTQFPLSIGQGPSQTADLIIFHGKQYVVTQLDDYTDFGAGFVSALCAMRSLENEPTPET